MDHRNATAARRGDWMQTYSGKQFWPLDPQVEDLDIIDIAAALSKDCRYGGHTLKFYSVAEHSVLMWREARRCGASLRDQRTTLLHDGSEGYLRDVIRPIKPDLANYKAIEHRLMLCIAERFDIDWPIPAHIKALDVRIGLAEAAQIMAPPPAPWASNSDDMTPLDVRIECWSPDFAFAQFMGAATRIGVLTHA
ncbi:hypothetical protein [Bradyrhizobium elkanii]|uniref:hypothetical protein n=1 Tax=Bradyrhizobium elkanii TaxID=29448 RepID=UPI00041D5C9A|nr:hypothetical protein [Bradyrhizobium elkanii]